MKKQILAFAGYLILASFLQGEEAGYGYIRQAISEDRNQRKEAAAKLIEMRERSLVPAMIDALFFTPRPSRKELVSVLQNLTGENRGDGYYEWVEWLGGRTDFKPASGYLEWKSLLLSKIDSRYASVLREGMVLKIRPEEIVWGGVKLDGIPALEMPPVIAAAEASYLTPDERVFGVSVNGEYRAYPLRILSWHEMTNDIIGGEPVTLSF